MSDDTKEKESQKDAAMETQQQPAAEERATRIKARTEIRAGAIGDLGGNGSWYP